MRASKRRTKKKVLRYIVGIIMIPFVAIILPPYKLYRKLRFKQNTKGRVQDIVDGFSYLVVKDSEVEKKAIERAKICGSCPHAKYNNKINTVVVGETIHQIKGMYCDRCGCSLAGKVRGENEYCPIRKW